MADYGTIGWQHAHPDFALQVAEFLHSRGIVACLLYTSDAADE